LFSLLSFSLLAEGHTLPWLADLGSRDHTDRDLSGSLRGGGVMLSLLMVLAGVVARVLKQHIKHCNNAKEAKQCQLDGQITERRKQQCHYHYVSWSRKVSAPKGSNTLRCSNRSQPEEFGSTHITPGKGNNAPHRRSARIKRLVPHTGGSNPGLVWPCR